MANTTFANLKIKALQKCDHYNADDSGLLTLAGGIINDVLSVIQTELKESPFCLDVQNTVSTVADQAYVDLTDTDILEIVNVSYRTTANKLIQIPWRTYIEIQTDPARWSGTPDIAYAIKQAVNASGVNIFSLFFIPTPSAVVTIYYDYIKNIRFSADGTAADASFSPLPMLYDEWIFALFKPRFFSIIDPENRSRIVTAEEQATIATKRFRTMAQVPVDQSPEMAPYRRYHRRMRVADTF